MLFLVCSKKLEQNLSQFMVLVFTGIVSPIRDARNNREIYAVCYGRPISSLGNSYT